MFETPEIFHEEAEYLDILYPSIAIAMCSSHLSLELEAQPLAELGDDVTTLGDKARDTETYGQAEQQLNGLMKDGLAALQRPVERYESHVPR
jgi:hypothetical protein